MILRVCVVIPSHEQQRTISQVVKGVIQKTRFPVLLVDDGSESPVSHYLYSFEVKEALEQGRVRIVRTERRLGRGLALRMAIRELLKSGYTHLLTFPADGSCCPTDINKLIEEGCRHPWSVISGCRQRYEESSEEPVTQWQKLLKFCNEGPPPAFVHDPASPIKLYPLFALQSLGELSTGQNWEFEVLSRLMWRGWDLREAPVQTLEGEVQPDSGILQRANERVRLSILKWSLGLLTFARRHREPKNLSLAAALGAFSGVVPSSALHFILALLMSVLLPVNFLALWLSALLVSGSLYFSGAEIQIALGKRFFGLSYQSGFMGHISQWAAGSFLTGLMFAVLFGLLVYLGAKAALKRQGLRRTSGFAATPQAWLGLNEFYSRLSPDLSFRDRQRRIRAHWAERAGWRRIILRDRSKLARFFTHSPGQVTLGAHVGHEFLSAQWQVDRPDRRSCELVPFLGGLGVFDPSGFDHAARTGQEVVLSCLLPSEKSGLERVELIGPKRLRYSPDSPPEIQRLTWLTYAVNTIEARVRENPHLWGNLFPFWSTVPNGGTGPGLLIEDLYEQKRVSAGLSLGSSELPYL